MVRSLEPILLAWSGGKESLMALRELRRQKEFDVCGLVTAVSDSDQRVTTHGVSREVVEEQARALGLPIDIVIVPKGCCPHTYNDCLAAAAAAKRDRGVSKIAFGDLYLDDVRDFREECLEMIGMEAIFPLWQMDTQELAWAYVHAKYKAVVTCVDEQSLPRSFVGRLYDRAFLSDLPLGVDPCGENGEFHTFVFDGPVFDHPVLIKQGTPYSEASMHYCDVLGQSNRPKQAMRRAR
jgi:uncharacterized protein (TIGR00290 family)